MIVDLQDTGPEFEAAKDPDAEAYQRNARWALADFECAHGKLSDEGCQECSA